MSQHDYDIANAPGATVRADINDVLAAINSKNSGPSDPPTPAAYSPWADTTANILKRRNAANTAWLNFDTLNDAKTFSKPSTFNIIESDLQTLFICTGTGYIITFNASVLLTDRFSCFVKNDTTGDITFDPDTTETFNGEDTFKISPGGYAFIWCDGSNLFAITSIYNNLSATTPPGATNDFSEGYKLNSRWLDVGDDRLYFPLDLSIGSAVWRELVGGEGFLNIGTPEEVTIISGELIITKTNHTIDTEADAATDDLDIINGGMTGDLIYLRAENTNRTVVVKDSTGNIIMAGDFSLDNTTSLLKLLFTGSVWIEISRSINT